MARKGKDSSNQNIQFFRMDYGDYNHTGGKDNGNWDTWQDGKFHFHIPINQKN